MHEIFANSARGASYSLSALNGHNFLNNGPVCMIKKLTGSGGPYLCRNMQGLCAKNGEIFMSRIFHVYTDVGQIIFAPVYWSQKVCKKICPTLRGKKIFCLFWGGKFLFVSTTCSSHSSTLKKTNFGPGHLFLFDST